MSELYIVATPIGNLEDITIRALNILKEVDVIACEDTRHSSRLLNKYEIRKRLVSCHAHNEIRGSKQVVSFLNEDKNAAYISDAGTPGISDPGSRLVSMAREAGHKVIPIPGASAFASIISIAGVSGKAVIFEGFLSPKSGRRKRRLNELLETKESFVIYESPFRILKLFADLLELSPDKYVIIGREMTKIHEEYLHGTVMEIYNELSNRSSIKGEFTIFVSNYKKTK